MRDFISTSLLKSIQEKSEKLQFFIEQKRYIGIQEAKERMERWCRNYEGLISSCKPVERLIRSIEFISDQEILDLLIRYLVANHSEEMICPVFTCFGEPSESSSRIMAPLKGDSDYVESMDDAVEYCRTNRTTCIITIDDMINTGNQFLQILRTWFCSEQVELDSKRNRLASRDLDFIKGNRIKFLFCFYYGMENGREKARKAIDEIGIDGQIIIIKQYSNRAGIFGSPETEHALSNGHRIGMRENEYIFEGIPWKTVSRFYWICKTVGEQILRAHKPKWEEERFSKCALGYGNSAKIVITQKNIPTSTLTCLWRGGPVTIDGKEVYWEPLFERREKLLGGSESSMGPLSSVQPITNYRLSDFPLDLVPQKSSGLDFAVIERITGTINPKHFNDVTQIYLADIDKGIEPPDTVYDTGLRVFRLNTDRYARLQNHSRIILLNKLHIPAKIKCVDIFNVSGIATTAVIRFQCSPGKEGTMTFNLNDVLMLFRRLSIKPHGGAINDVVWRYNQARNELFSSPHPRQILASLLGENSSERMEILSQNARILSFVRTTGNLFRTSKQGINLPRSFARTISALRDSAPERIPILELDDQCIIAVSERAALMLAGDEKPINCSGWHESFMMEYLLVYILNILNSCLASHGFSGSKLNNQLQEYQIPWFFEKKFLKAFASVSRDVLI